MAREIGTISNARWPDEVQLPVVLTFEHQSGEGTPPLPGDRPNYMMGGALEYGGRTGIWNILELLDTFGVKATFFVCGTTAEKYPDAVCAAHKAGHEIAGMSYSFERVRTASVAARASDRSQDCKGTERHLWRRDQRLALSRTTESAHRPSISFPRKVSVGQQHAERRLSRACSIARVVE